MIIFWFAVALSGLLAGLYIAHVIATKIVARPTDAAKQFKITIAVLALLSAAFLIPTFFTRVAANYYFDVSSRWRLFGIFGYADLFIAIFFITSAIYISIAYFRFRSRDDT
jgi:ABC-type transport system involved in multi-copper enzyme maturation permease subunit